MYTISTIHNGQAYHNNVLNRLCSYVFLFSNRKTSTRSIYNLISFDVAYTIWPIGHIECSTLNVVHSSN